MKIYLWRGSKSRISRIIKWFTGGDISHVGFVDKDGYIIEADMFKNGIIRHKNTFQNDPDYTEIELPFGEEELEKIQEIALELMDKIKYDYWLILCHAFGYKKVKNYRRLYRKTRMICSEFVAFCIYRATGKNLIEKFPSNIQPHEFAILLEERV